MSRIDAESKKHTNRSMNATHQRNILPDPFSDGEPVVSRGIIVDGYELFHRGVVNLKVDKDTRVYRGVTGGTESNGVDLRPSAAGRASRIRIPQPSACDMRENQYRHQSIPDSESRGQQFL